MKLIKCYSRKTDALKQTQVPRGSWLPANSGQEHLPLRTKWVCKGGYRSRLRDLEDSQLWWDEVICSLTKPKPGAERTKGRELSGGTDLLAAADSPSPTCYPIWLNNHFKYRGAGTVTERPAGSGQMPLPIKLWCRLPKNGHIKMESVHPTFKYRGFSKRLGLMRAARRELITTNVLNFPLRIKCKFFPSCKYRPFLQYHFIWCGVYVTPIFYHENRLF